MKDNWLDMLFNLFEITFSKLRDNPSKMTTSENYSELDVPENSSFLFVKAPSENSHRVYSSYERLRFTKSSYQFLVRLNQWQVVPAELFEMAMEHLLLTHPWEELELAQTKQILLEWFYDKLAAEQYAFLEIVFQQTSDRMVAH